ncbi:hypothetical protein Tco_0379022 [Tanacetum coccineum]
MEPPVNKRRKQMRCKRVNEEVEVNAPSKVLRKYHVSSLAHSIHGGKSLVAMGLDAGSTFSTPDAQDDSTTAKSVSDPDPLSYSKPQPFPEQDITQSSKGTATEIPPQHVEATEGSPSGIYQRVWGVTNSCRLDTPEACQDLVDHTVPPGYFLELRHLPNAEFLGQYNMNLARQVAIGSQLWLRFEQEARLLKKARAKIARRDQRIQLSQQVSHLQVQVTGEERIKAAFEEFKKYEDNKPHMLTAIAGRRWVIGHGLRLAVMKCAESSEIRQAFANVVSAGLAKGMSEGLKYGIEHGKAGRDLADVKAYDLEANNKLVKALQDLKDLKYPMWIRDLHLSSSQLKIPIYPEVRAPKDPWAVKKEVPLEDVIAANISRAEKKKKCGVVCRTHGIGSTYHARPDGILVSVPTVGPQGLAILLTDAGTQTQRSEDKASLRLFRSKSLPPMYNLD